MNYRTGLFDSPLIEPQEAEQCEQLAMLVRKTEGHEKLMGEFAYLLGLIRRMSERHLSPNAESDQERNG